MTLDVIRLFAHFRGEFAAASLKQMAEKHDHGNCVNFRGEFAAASLKRDANVRVRLVYADFRGEFAAASLKQGIVFLGLRT